MVGSSNGPDISALGFLLIINSLQSIRAAYFNRNQFKDASVMMRRKRVASKGVIPMNLPNPFPGFPNQPKFNNVVSVTNNNFFQAVKAGKNGVWISFILDESGSMASCCDQTIAGFNEYLYSQKSQPGNCWVSLVKFDSPRIIPVYDKLPITEVPNLSRANYHPNGGTNLIDCVGDTITKINDTLRGMKRKERPAILVVVLTDGEENSSRRFSKNQIAEMTGLCQEAGHVYTYLGANQDSWKAASSIGIAQTHAYTYSTSNMAQTMATVGASTARYRAAVAKGIDTSKQDFYSAEERAQEVK
jgi:uncharacterized protein YegL